MKKKLFTLFAILICGTLASLAQPEVGTFSITPKVGVNLSKLTGDPAMSVTIVNIPDWLMDNPSEPQWGTLDPDQQLQIFSVTFSEGTAHRFGWRAGVEASYQLTSRFALAAELKYSLQGVKYDDVDIPEHTTHYSKLDRTIISNISLSQHYLQLPLLARYYVLPGLAVQAGLQPGYCISSKLNCDINYGGKTVDIPNHKVDYLSKFDLSIPVGISYEAKGVVLDARYNIGLTNVNKEPFIKGMPTPSSRNSVIEISVGYRFGL